MSIEDAKSWDFPPSNAGSLGKRIRNLADKVGIEPDLMEVAFAQVILGQMLPGVLRGGAALKIGLGPFGSRFSSDADLVLPHSMVPDSFEEWINEGKKEPVRQDTWITSGATPGERFSALVNGRTARP